MQPSSQQLHGKVALITGASSGIGREAARLFARHGARLVLTARRQPELQALVAEIEQDGGQAIALAGDVRTSRWPGPWSKPPRRALAAWTSPSTMPA